MPRCSFIPGLLIIPSYQSNVLIDDDRHARLCDFGLSTFLLNGCEDDGISKSIQSVYTSHLGGSVRWADASLFCSLEEDRPYHRDTERYIFLWKCHARGDYFLGTNVPRN